MGERDGGHRSRGGGERRPAPAIVEEALRSPGEPLPEPVIAAEQPRFPVDLRRVRVHTGAVATASASAIGAVAFTAGRHVVFRTGAWAPGTAAGRELLRHELTHVAEQGAVEPSPGVRLELSAGAAAEAGAEAAERGAAGPVRSTELRIAAKAEAPRPEDPPPGPGESQRAHAEIVRRRTASRQAPIGDVLRGLSGRRAKEELRALTPKITRWLGPIFDRRTLEERALLYTDDLTAPFVRLAEAHVLDRSHPAVRRLFEDSLALAERQAAEAGLKEAFGDHLLDRDFVRSLLYGGALIGGRPSTVPRALTLLQRDLTPADLLFFGLRDGDDDVVLAQLKQALGTTGSLGRFGALSKQWDELIVAPPQGRPDLLASLPHHEQGLLKALRPGFPRSLYAGLSGDALREFDALYESARRRDALVREQEEQRRRQEAEARDPALRLRRLTALIERIERRLLQERNGWIIDIIGRESFADIQEIERIYRERNRRELIADYKREAFLLDEAEFKTLALLTTGRDGDPYAEVGRAVVVARDALAAHRQLYPLGTSERATFHRYYTQAFAGLVRGDGERTAVTHVMRFLFDPTGIWKLEKTLVLLDHRPTPAEELYFVTWCPGGFDGERALQMIQSAAGGEATRLRALADDWAKTVVPSRHPYNGEPWCELDLWPAMTDIFEGYDSRRFEQLRPLFAAYWRSQRPTREPANEQERIFFAERERLQVAREAIAAELSHTLPVKSRVFARFAEIGRVFGERRDRPLTLDQVRETGEERQTVARLIETWGAFGTRLGERDKLRARLLVARDGKLSAGDEIYLTLPESRLEGGSEAEARATLTKATDAWLKKQEKQAFSDLTNAVLDPFSLGVVVRGGAQLPTVEAGALSGAVARAYRLARLMLDPNLDRVGAGAMRLHEEFDVGGFNHRNDDLRAGYDFLRQVDAAERPAIIKRYVETYVRGFPNEPPETRLILSLRSRFESTVALVDLEALVRGAQADTEEQTRFLELRELAIHSGAGGSLLDLVQNGLAGVQPSDPQAYVRRSLQQLRDLTRDQRLQPQVVASAREQSGAVNNEELATRLVTLTRSYQDEVLTERKALAESIGNLIQVVGRSALVALTGPVGLTGLAAGLVAIGASYGVRELLLGSNYDATSRKNLATLATEASGTLFELAEVEAKLEALVKTIVKQSEFGQIVVTELAKTALSESFDGGIERIILQNGLPQLPAIEGKLLATTLQATLKAGLKAPVSDRINVVAEVHELWAYQTLKILINGPPPAAALPRALIGTAAKFGNVDAPELTGESLVAALKAALATSLQTALSVGTAFTAVKVREFREAEAVVGQNTAGFFGKLEQNRTLKKLYDEVTGEKPPLAEWALRTAFQSTDGRLRQQIAKQISKEATGFLPPDEYGLRPLLRPFIEVAPTTDVLQRRAR